jgi:hypothetical protein
VHTKYFWLYLKKAINELSTTENSPFTSTDDKLLKSLFATVKKLSAPTAMLPKLSIYTDHAYLASSQSVHEKLVLSRALKEVMIKVIGDLKLF